MDANLETSTLENNRSVVVAILGSYHRGKTFLLNQLCKVYLPTGHFIHPEGISITKARHNVENAILIGTTITDTAIPKR